MICEGRFFDMSITPKVALTFLHGSHNILFFFSLSLFLSLRD